jgi:hypothetical protein
MNSILWIQLVLPSVLDLRCHCQLFSIMGHWTAHVMLKVLSLLCVTVVHVVVSVNQTLLVNVALDAELVTMAFPTVNHVNVLVVESVMM